LLAQALPWRLREALLWVLVFPAFFSPRLSRQGQQGAKAPWREAFASFLPVSFFSQVPDFVHALA